MTKTIFTSCEYCGSPDVADFSDACYPCITLDLCASEYKSVGSLLARPLRRRLANAVARRHRTERQRAR